MVLCMVYRIEYRFYLCHLHDCTHFILCLLLFIHCHNVWTFQFISKNGRTKNKLQSNTNWPTRNSDDPYFGPKFNDQSNQSTQSNYRVSENAVKNIEYKKRKIHFSYRSTHILATIVSGQIFALLPANAIYMAVSMFDAEQVITLNERRYSNSWKNITNLILFFFLNSKKSAAHFDILVFLFDMSCIISALLWPFLFCHFANSVTDEITRLGFTVYNSNWYDFPNDLQKYIPLVIIRSREPVYFTGLGLIRCTLKVFGDVSKFPMCIWWVDFIMHTSFQLLRTSCSYYMLYKTFAR